MSMQRLIRPLAVLVLTLCGFAAHAATFNVTRGDDPVPNGCLAADCSLREAIEATAATPEADTIVLGAGQYQVTRGELAIDGAISITGAGSAATRIIGQGDDVVLHAVPFGTLTVEGIEIATADGAAVLVEDNATATLRDILVPPNAGGVGTATPNGDVGSGSLRVEHSTIRGAVACFQPQGSCRIFDSRLHEMLLSDSELELVRVDLDGENTDHYGLSIAGTGAVTIEDSTIQHTQTPLHLFADNDSAPTVHIRRTRFLDNTGPLYGERSSIVDMDEVEFRHHVISDDIIGAPAVLFAGPGPLWFISKALVVANRGGADLDGAVIRVVAGGRVAFDNSTFDDNTFRQDVGAGFGHTIGVYNDGSAPSILWLFHATMRRSIVLEDDTVGSLLTVRGASADVRVDNSALQGTCGFGGGGALAQATGNAESSGDTCTFDPATNQVEVPAFQISLGDLADHGGFTETFYPTLNSILRDAAEEAFCVLFAPLDQRGYVRPTDGIECDIGAVEVAAVSDSIFADGFDG
jgi:hypothetical protein